MLQELVPRGNQNAALKTNKQNIQRKREKKINTHPENELKASSPFVRNLSVPLIPDQQKTPLRCSPVACPGAGTPRHLPGGVRRRRRAAEEEGRGWKAAAQPASPCPCSLGAPAPTSDSAESMFWGSPWPRGMAASGETRGQAQPVLGGVARALVRALSLWQCHCHRLNATKI